MAHDDKLKILQTRSLETLANDYYAPDVAEDDFMEFLEGEYELWDPDNLGSPRTTGAAPRKDIVIGSWRDLNRAEALLELIDNSIDSWHRRKKKYPTRTAKRLSIYIDVDTLARRLIYEDNAGGVSPDRIENLVIPGHSETTDLESTIGSYRTGGKKAVFKLALEANIRTRYFDPTGHIDVPLQIHLDREWLENQTIYEFPSYIMKKPDIERGQTRYTLRLRDHWDTETFDQITLEIRRTYTLLMLRFPVHIFFNDREHPLKPLEDLYTFSGKHDKQTDLRPQRVHFLTKLKWRNRSHSVRVEMILGCRTTTAAFRGEDGAGIDLYGNNRLFIFRDQEHVKTWYPSIPKGNARLLMRGLINIHAPNIFIPWDVHKRHLNADRELVALLRTDRLMTLFVKAWVEVYQAVSRSDVKNLIKDRFLPWRTTSDLNVAYDDEIDLPTGRKQGITWPASIHLPTVPPPKKLPEKPAAIRFLVNRSEFRELCAHFDVRARWDDKDTLKELSEEIKDYLLSQ